MTGTSHLVEGCVVVLIAIGLPRAVAQVHGIEAGDDRHERKADHGCRRLHTARDWSGQVADGVYGMALTSFRRCPLNNV